MKSLETTLIGIVLTVIGVTLLLNSNNEKKIAEAIFNIRTNIDLTTAKIDEKIEEFNNKLAYADNDKEIKTYRLAINDLKLKKIDLITHLSDLQANPDANLDEIKNKLTNTNSKIDQKIKLINSTFIK